MLRRRSLFREEPRRIRRRETLRPSDHVASFLCAELAVERAVRKQAREDCFRSVDVSGSTGDEDPSLAIDRYVEETIGRFAGDAWQLENSACCEGGIERSIRQKTGDDRL